jgi:hypothetical protein
MGVRLRDRRLVVVRVVTRLRLAWRLLRGRSVVYNCGIALTEQKLYIGGLKGGKVSIVECGFGPFLENVRGEVFVCDYESGLLYPLWVEDRTP